MYFRFLSMVCPSAFFPCSSLFYFFFFKQKTAYEISECDWSSDVCSSDLWLHLVSLLKKISFPISSDSVKSAKSLDCAASHFVRSEERRVGKECRIGCR